MRSHYKFQLIVLFNAIFVGCQHKAHSPSELQELKIEPVLTSVPALSDKAVLDMKFVNKSSSTIVLPVGQILLEQNLHIRLYRPGDTNPFDKTGPFARQSPFQFPTDDIVAIPPKGSYTYRFSSFLGTQRGRWNTKGSGVFIVKRLPTPFPRHELEKMAAEQGLTIVK